MRNRCMRPLAVAQCEVRPFRQASPPELKEDRAVSLERGTAGISSH